MGTNWQLRCWISQNSNEKTIVNQYCIYRTDIKLENQEISKFVGGVQWECGDGKMKRSDIQNKDKLYKKLEISGLIE